MENWIVGLVTTVGLSFAAYLVESGARVLREELKKKRAEAEAAQKQVLAVAFKGAEQVLETVTKVTVGELESGTASELREKVKKGEAEYGDLCKVSETACREIIGQLKPEVQAVLLECISDLEKHIRNQIEAVLPEVKAEQAKCRAQKHLADGLIEGGAGNGTEAA